MFLRTIAAIVLVLSVTGAWLGNSAGRSTVRDHSDCFLFGMFDYFTGERPERTKLFGIKGTELTITSEARHTCRSDYREETRSAVDGAVVVALIAIALGAAFVSLIPRRW